MATGHVGCSGPIYILYRDYLKSAKAIRCIGKRRPKPADACKAESYGLQGITSPFT